MLHCCSSKPSSTSKIRCAKVICAVHLASCFRSGLPPGMLDSRSLQLIMRSSDLFKSDIGFGEFNCLKFVLYIYQVRSAFFCSSFVSVRCSCCCETGL